MDPVDLSSFQLALSSQGAAIRRHDKSIQEAAARLQSLVCHSIYLLHSSSSLNIHQRAFHHNIIWGLWETVGQFHLNAHFQTATIHLLH